MLKNRELIERLTAEQKRELAASLRAFSADWARRAGLAPFRRADITRIEGADGETGFPSFGALANSWNAALAGEVCGALARQKTEEEPALCFMPPVNLRAHPGGDGASEDAYLLGSYAAEIAAAVRGAGALPCFSVLPGGKNAEMLDETYEPLALNDCYLAPLAQLHPQEFAVSLPCPAEGRANPNMAAAREKLLALAEEGGSVLCENAAGRSAAAVAEGCVLGSGDAGELAAAREEYARLYAAVTRGEALHSELSAECRAGTALSEETIDEAADRAISLSRRVLSARENFAEAQTDAEGFARRAAEESAVLLANDGGLLPLREGCSVAVFGDTGADFCAVLEGAGLHCAGFAAGYAPEEERSDELLPPACELAAKADAAVVFLAGKGDGKLPANRLALLGALARVNPNLIAVISPDAPCDISFRGNAPAIFAAGVQNEPARAALANLLSGRASPSGRLAVSRYADTGRYADSLVCGREEGRFKIGPFIGYRRDEAEGSPAAFPFGHGLSYSTFEYSGLKVQYSSAEVTVKNTGTRDAFEVVQLYVGKAESAFPRPKKELKGFKKIFLRAGEAQTVSFRIPPAALQISDGADSVIEEGVYDVYVGSSSADIRLTEHMYVRGENLPADKEADAAYLRSRSNVLSGNYTLGKVKRAPVRGQKQFRAGLTLLIIVALSILLSVSLHLAGVIVLFNTDVVFSCLIAFVCPILFIVGLVLFIVGACKRRRAKREAAVVSEGCLAEAKQTEEEWRYEDLFAAAFDGGKGREEPREPLPQKREPRREEIGFFDASYTLAEAAAQLSACCAFRGISLGEGGARRLLSAFCASRLIFADIPSARLLPALAEALGDFFGSGAYFADASAYVGHSDLLHAESGEQTAAAKAIAEAARQRQTVCTAVLGGVKISPEALFGPLCSCFSAPELSCGEGEIPPNVWFLCAPEGGAPSAAAELAGASCRIRLDISEAPRAKQGGARPLPYYQLIRLSQKCAKEYGLDEDACWKKIDGLERAAAGVSPFRFGNKVCLKTERFSSACLALGAEQGEALDEAAAACLLPVLAAEGGERLRAADAELEEEHFPESRKQLASYGV